MVLRTTQLRENRGETTGWGIVGAGVGMGNDWGVSLRRNVLLLLESRQFTGKTIQ